MRRIDNVRAALAVVAACVHQHRRDETIVVLLGIDYRPVSVVVVNGTNQPDDVIDVVERVVDPRAHDGQAQALVVASLYTDHAYTDPDRMVDRWYELSDICDAAGAELLEWFVVTDAVVCPRDLVGESPRWPTADTTG